MRNIYRERKANQGNPRVCDVSFHEVELGSFWGTVVENALRVFEC